MADSTGSGAMIVGLIPARAGSKGLPGKNTRMLAGQPLISHTINAAHLSKLDAAVVSSDCEVCLELAGDKVGTLKRPPELATDGAKMLDVVKHFAECLGEKIGAQPKDAIMVLYPTYPLRTSRDIDAILKAYDGRPLIGLMPPKTHPFLVMKRDEWTGKISPVIPHDRNRFYRRQDYPACYQLTMFACVLPVGRLGDMDAQMICEDTTWFDVPPERSVDIDTEADFQLAEMLLAKGKS